MTDTEARTSDEAGIRGPVEQRIAALLDRDADRLVAIYSPEVVKFGLPPPLQARGPGVAGSAFWRPWLPSWAGPITLDVTEVDIFVGGDLAFAHSPNRMRGTKADGGPQGLWSDA